MIPLARFEASMLFAALLGLQVRLGVDEQVVCVLRGRDQDRFLQLLQRDLGLPGLQQQAAVVHLA